MKNLKKVLSLVLALAMALSLMTAAFAADASDYKDYSKVTYKEAVDVMTAAGIFNGGDGNNFNPDATLNREQAAKIITYMLVGQAKADKLTATVAPYAETWQPTAGVLAQSRTAPTQALSLVTATAVSTPLLPCWVPSLPRCCWWLWATIRRSRAWWATAGPSTPPNWPWATRIWTKAWKRSPCLLR